MMPTHENSSRHPAAQARLRALLKVVKEIPNAIRSSLDRYYTAFSDDPAAARRNVERHARKVALDFIRCDAAGLSATSGIPSEVRRDEILIAALSQLTAWHELHPQSERYQFRPQAHGVATDDLEAEAWLTSVDPISVEEEDQASEEETLSAAEDRPFDFDGLNQAVLAWSGGNAAVDIKARNAVAPPAKTSREQLLSAGYDRLRQEVFGLARRLIQNEHDAAEIYQESLKGLAKLYAGGRCNKRNLVENLKTILRRRVIDFVRRQLGPVKPGGGREGRLRPVTNGPDLAQIASPNDRAVDERLEAHDQYRVFIEHVLALPTRQGELLIGEFVDELGKGELPAKVECVLGIGIPMPVVYAERQKALAVIRDQLTRTGWSFPRLFTPHRHTR